MRYFRKSSARSNSTQPMAIKDVMSDYLETYESTTPYVESHLRTAWCQMMGESISDRTKRLYVQDRVLYIELTSAPLKQELSMSSRKIRDFLNRSVRKKRLDKVVFI